MWVKMHRGLEARQGLGKCGQVCRLSDTLAEAGLKLSFESDKVFLGEQRNGLGDRKLHYAPQGNIYPQNCF